MLLIFMFARKKENTQELTMKYVEGQIVMWIAYLLRDHAEIVSGAYKLRKTERGCEKTPEHPTGWRPLTDEEKLEDVMGTMTRRCEFIAECIEHLDKE